MPHCSNLNQRYRWRSANRCAGFTYLSILILIAIIGLVSASSLQVGSILQRRAAEEELIEIGAEFRNALMSFAAATPVGQKQAPNTLQDLLKDPRFPTTRRHLRKFYSDPITGKEEWGMIMAPDGSGLIGVYSLSDAKPIKTGHFDAAFQGFEDKKSYRDWRFTISAPQPLLSNPPSTSIRNAP